jgi:tetratricopeptide (TPR) repeat protein
MQYKSMPILKISEFFEELPAKRQSFLESRLKKIKYKSGTEIIQQGQIGDYLGIVESGRVKKTNGRSRIEILSSGNYFGTEMLQFGKPSSYTITAQTDAVIKVLKRADWVSPNPRIRRFSVPSWVPRPSKTGWVMIITTLAIAMILVVLGPSLLEYSNNTLPDRFVEQGRPDLAEQYLDFVINLQPESAKLYGNLGDVLVLQDKPLEAIDAYQQALTIDEYLPWIQNNLGVLLLDQGEPKLAETHLLSALDLSPENIDIYRNLGNTYYAQENWEAALEVYQEALEMDFTLMDTKAAWAGLILQNGRLVEARLVWEDVLRQDPRHSLALQGLGAVSLLEGDPTLAMIYFDAASYITPDDPTLRLYTGLAWEGLGKPENAVTEYQFVTESKADPRLVSLARALLHIVKEQINQSIN